MRYTRALVLGAALLTSGATFASAQAIVPVQWGWQHRDDDDRQAFRDGFERGRWDAEHRRRSDWDDNCRYREDDDRRAYHSGYLFTVAAVISRMIYPSGISFGI